MKAAPKTNEVPHRDELTDENGLITQPWQSFFTDVRGSLDPLGVEKSFVLKNNQATPANIDGLTFSSRGVSHATVDYLIQRVTDVVELIQSGSFHLVYRPLIDDWRIVVIGTPGPDVSGITFSITHKGAVQYISTNIAGFGSISKITFRARTLGAKNSQYSKVGR